MTNANGQTRPKVVDSAQLSRIEATHRGFLYQHLYVAAVLLRAAEFKASSVLVESDEDLEVLSDTGRIYVQVKLRAETLGWPDVSEAIDRFASYRALHENGTRAGSARFIIASSAPPRASLIKRMNESSWPADVAIEWPAEQTRSDEIVPWPRPSVIAMADHVRSLAERLPFAVLTPDTLMWKLAGVVTLAAAGQPPRTDHQFRISDLPELFEQLVIQLQDFPAPPNPYREQEDEPSLSGKGPARLITGYSGSGKTSWAANAALHTIGTFIYFDAQDVPGGGLAAGLAREIAARIFQEKGGLGQVLLPGASGMEILKSIGGQHIVGEPVSVVLDNAHIPPAVDVAACVRAAQGIDFVLLGQPGRSAQELAALLQIEQETLVGWSADTIAAEAASHSCIVDPASCQMMLDQTGGLPLYIQNAVQIATTEHAGSLSDFCNKLAALSHTVETAQEFILAHVIDTLPESASRLLAILSISDIAISRDDVAAYASAVFDMNPVELAASLRRLRTAGLVQAFGGAALKVHDAARLVGRGRLLELGEATAQTARRTLKDLLANSIRERWEYRKVILYIRLLGETGEIKTLVQFGTDEVFHEMGFWPIIEPHLMKAAFSEQVDPESRFWALDGIVFNEMRKHTGTPRKHIDEMKRLVQRFELGGDEHLAVGMKEMTLLAQERNAEGARRLMDTVRAGLRNTPAHSRIFRYNAASSMYFLEEYDVAEAQVLQVLDEYFKLLGVRPETVVGLNPPELYPLLNKTPDLEDDIKHLADCLDLLAKIKTAQGAISPFARLHAMKFYAMANSPESLIRVGQDLVDEFMSRRDFVGAREIIETNLLPTLQELKLASYLIPVRSHYAVVLAYCGDFRRADAEMERLAPYEVGLSPQGRTELLEQRRIIAQLKLSGPPPQLQLPPNLPQRMASFRDAMNRASSQRPRKRVGRNDPCPCGSGAKFKKCHGSGG
ncbi:MULTISPECIES: YecA family protein [Shinella]|jgi:hypothetical protein|uniref:SEC-C metal-binding domain-containing protein n=1 Tax=Shinella sumterensis TaxID=1967501 RepID=A0AA50H7P2_9HYPH|nr:SEC-C metal-binding domain-containing protein [Shinella sumterensis]WLS01265.1 SEC-C metal-binding domain-containing protein [Shinella sumterensis]